MHCLPVPRSQSCDLPPLNITFCPLPSQKPGLHVEKSFSLRGEASVGETVDFSIAVRNDGNVDLMDVALTDAMFKNDEGEIRV